MSRLALVAAAVFLLASVLTLGVRPLIAHDEARYAAIPAEMLDRGDWTELRLAGFRYYEKPPLGYWLSAASMQALGQSPWAIRLPCALASGVTALCAWWIAAGMTRRRTDGPLAFMVQATTLGPAIIGTVALLDPPFAACIALTMAAFWSACNSRGKARLAALALTGAAAGAAFLVKGLLGIAIPGLAAAGFLAWERRWRDLALMPWIPLCAAALAIAPVAALLHRSEPGFWRYFIEIEHIRRFTSPDSNQHPEPWWFFLVLFPVGACMWTLAWPRAIQGLWGAASQRDAVLASGIRFCLSWIALPTALLSASSGKLPTYLLPLYAPASVLVAVGLRSAFDQGLVTRQRADAFGSALLLCIAGASAVLALTGTEAWGLAAPWSTGARLPLLVIAATMVAWAAIDRWGWRASDSTAWVTRQALAVTPLLCALCVLMPDALMPRIKRPWDVLGTHAARISEASLLLASAETAHAVSLASGRRDFLLVGWPGEFDNELGLETEDARLIDWGRAPDAALRSLAIPGVSVMLVSDPWMADGLCAIPGMPPPELSERHGNLAIVLWRSPVHSEASGGAADAPVPAQDD